MQCAYGRLDRPLEPIEDHAEALARVIAHPMREAAVDTRQPIARVDEHKLAGARLHAQLTALGKLADGEQVLRRRVAHVAVGRATKAVCDGNGGGREARGEGVQGGARSTPERLVPRRQLPEK